MRLRLAMALPVSAERAWKLVQTFALLEHVAVPVMRFVAVEPATLSTVLGYGACRVRTLLFGLPPLGFQWIVISKPTAGAGRYRIRDNGRGSLARWWDGLITIEPAGADGCRYIDEVEVEAGMLTPFVWLFARIFYRHRQRRWRALAARQGAGLHWKVAACDYMGQPCASIWRANSMGYRRSLAAEDLAAAWRSLERAHVLSQSMVDTARDCAPARAQVGWAGPMRRLLHARIGPAARRRFRPRPPCPPRIGDAEARAVVGVAVRAHHGFRATSASLIRVRAVACCRRPFHRIRTTPYHETPMRALPAAPLAASLGAAAQAPSTPPRLTLRHVLMQAYADTPLGQEASAPVDVDLGRLAQAWLRPNPVLSVSVDQFAGSGPLSGTRQPECTALTLPFEPGGKRAAWVAAGEAADGRARRALTRLDLARAVQEAYATAFGAQSLEALARDEAALAAEIERTVGLLVNGGCGPPLRLVTARVERAGAVAVAAVAAAAGETLAAHAGLAALIGRADAAFTLADAPSPRPALSSARPTSRSPTPTWRPPARRCGSNGRCALPTSASASGYGACQPRARTRSSPLSRCRYRFQPQRRCHFRRRRGAAPRRGGTPARPVRAGSPRVVGRSPGRG